MPKIIKRNKKIAKMVEEMSGYHMTIKQMCAILRTIDRGMAPDTLRKYYMPEIERGRAISVMLVSKSMFRMATSNRCPQATQYFLDRKGGWGKDEPPEATETSDNDNLMSLLSETAQADWSDYGEAQ